MKAHCRLFVRRPPSHFVLLKSRAYCGIPAEPSCPLSAATVCSFFAFAPPSSCCRRFLFVVVVIVFLVLHSFVCPFARCTEASWGYYPLVFPSVLFLLLLALLLLLLRRCCFLLFFLPFTVCRPLFSFCWGCSVLDEDTVYEGAEAPAKGGGGSESGCFRVVPCSLGALYRVLTGNKLRRCFWCSSSCCCFHCCCSFLSLTFIPLTYAQTDCGFW